MPDNITNHRPALAAVIKRAFINLLKEVHTTIPGEIVSFDPELQSAEVQPTIRRVYVNKGADGSEEESFVEIPKLINVPVVFLRGGGWCITFPVKPGDECIIHFSERAIDQWRKNSGVQNPKDWRMHEYSDAICQVGLSSEPKVITDFDNEHFQVRNEEGDVHISLREDKKVHIITPVKIFAEAPEMQFDASSKIDFNTPIANFSGDVNIAGTSTADVDHVSAGKSGASHTHNINSGSSAPGPTAGPN